jgi:putative restriction endonuclease
VEILMARSGGTDTDIIVEALKDLAGPAHLSSIYERVDELSGGRIAQETVRGRLEDHSSDSNVWRNSKQKRPDLFKSLGIGSGWWCLRSFEEEQKARDYFEDAADMEFSEGLAYLHVHLKRERSKELIKKFKNQLKHFKCSVCDFDFGTFYGSVGVGFIEAHHSTPLAKMKSGTKTKLSDLVAVCSNCHAMLHRNGHLDWKILKQRLSEKGTRT